MLCSLKKHLLGKFSQSKIWPSTLRKYVSHTNDCVDKSKVSVVVSPSITLDYKFWKPSTKFHAVFVLIFIDVDA